MQEENPQPFADVGKPGTDDTRRCPGCGTSVADLYVDGRMGCARCYETFPNIIQRALVALHGANEHMGKRL